MAFVSSHGRWVLLLILGLYLFRKLIRRHRHAQVNRLHRCKEPRHYPHKDYLLGLDLYLLRRDAKSRGLRGPFSERLFRQYGKTFQANVWGRKWTYTMEPRNIQTVAMSIGKFELGKGRQGVGAQFIGLGVATTDGRLWEHSRALIRPVFARKQIANLKSFEKHVNRMIELVPRDGSTVDLQPLLKRLVRWPPFPSAP